MRKNCRSLLLASLALTCGLLASCLSSGPEKPLGAMADAMEKNDSAAFLAQMDMPLFAANEARNMTNENEALNMLDSLGQDLGLGGMDQLLGSALNMEDKLRKSLTRGVSTGELMAHCRKAERPDCPWVPESLRNAKVVELPGGPGTVGVTLVDSNDRAPSEEIVEAVEAHIEEERPVGAAVTVAAATEREVTVAAQVSLTGGAGAGAVQDAFRAALAGYLHTLIEGKYGTVYYKPADDQPYTLLYNRVLALLLNVEGVENFASLTVNGGTAGVTIQAGEIPVLGEVSVT